MKYIWNGISGTVPGVGSVVKGEEVFVKDPALLDKLIRKNLLLVKKPKTKTKKSKTKV